MSDSFEPIKISNDDSDEVFKQKTQMNNGYIAQTLSSIQSFISNQLDAIKKTIIKPALRGGFNVDDIRYYGTLSNAVASIPSTTSKTLYITNDQSIAGDLTVPNNISLIVLNGGTLQVASAKTLTINGPFEAGDFPVFTGAGTTVFGRPGDTWVNWFYKGSDYGAAINAAFACRSNRGNRVYNPPLNTAYFSTKIQPLNHHISWIGYPSSSNDDTVARLIWNGSVTESLFTSTSGIVGFKAFDIALDGAHITKWGFLCDSLRRSYFDNIFVFRCVGPYYFTNPYYNTFGRISATLQTPGTYINTGSGQPGILLSEWKDVCNNGFKAPITFQSNANNLRIEKLAISRMGAYELPVGGTAIIQLVLLSGNNIHCMLPTFESIESNQVASGPEDGDKFGYYTGVQGTTDTYGQFSVFVIAGLSAANSNNHNLYFALNDSLGTRTVNAYKTQAAATANAGVPGTAGDANYVMGGSLVGDGILILHEQNSSGLHGQVTISWTHNVTNLIWRGNYLCTTSIVKVGGGTSVDIDQIYMEAAFVTHVLSIASKMRGGMYIGKIYAEDYHIYGAWCDSGGLKDLTIGSIVGIGGTQTGPYISDNSVTTRLRFDSMELHNRFVVSGGANYSEEMAGFLGVNTGPSALGIIYRPYVVSGLVASTSSDALGYYVQVTPGSIMDGQGKAILIGRFEEANSLQTAVGWRFRPSAGTASYNVCVDACGLVFIENQSSLRASDDQGKIILATFNMSALGVISSFVSISNPKCLRGIDIYNGGAVNVSGNFTVSTDKFQVGSSIGSVSMGTTPNPDVGFFISEGYTGLSGPVQRGLLVRPTFSSSATGQATPIEANLRIAPGFTLPDGAGMRISDSLKGAGSTITTQYGLKIEDQSGGTTNYSIYTGVTGPQRFGTLKGIGTRFVFADTDGVLSATGTSFPQGATGVQGIQGVTGPIVVGFTGTQGPQGNQGFTGLVGSQGVTGLVGPSGTTGLAGVTGIGNIPGISNFSGATGISSGFTGANYLGTNPIYFDPRGTEVGIATALAINSTVKVSSLTASSALASDSSKQLVSVTNTGSGNNVLSASPTLTGTIVAASQTLSGTLGLTSTSSTLGIGVGAQPDTGIYVSEFLTALTGSTQYGILDRVKFSSAATVAGKTLGVQVRTAASAFTMGLGMGIYVEDANVGAGSAITTLYGIYINDQTGGGTNVALRTGTGQVQIGDILKLIASSTSRATLNIPSGTAPTSPVSGDCWYDGTNLKFRDGSTTRTITWT